LEYNKEKLVGMEIEKIENGEDYQNVLQRIDELMNAKPGSPEYEELLRLTDLIEDYEDDLCS